MPDLVLPGDGPLIARPGDANDHIGEAWGAGADRVVIPVGRLAPDFFRLASGLAGEVLQKFTNYGLKVVIVGDISGPLARSAPLRDFVHESNRQGQIRFVASLAEL
jgi:hypothetical protein